MSERAFKRVVVTGGAGFIGSNFVRYALSAHPGWDITVVDKLTYAGNLENLADVMDKIAFVRGDISLPSEVREAISGADAVLNFAAESHVDRSLADPTPFVRTNVEGTLVLLNESMRAGVSRFLQVSTDEVYGDLCGYDGHSVESDPLRPRSPYAASKAAAEHLVFSYFTSYNLDVVITRGSNTYGPYQYPEKIIPLFVTNLIEDKKLPLYGDGTAVRDYMHVDDHARGIDAVLHKGTAGEAYNLGAGEQISGNELATDILRIMQKSPEYIRHVKDRPGHDYRYSIDSAKAHALGWRCLRCFEQGLPETIKWYVENPQWWSRLKQNT